DLGHRHREDRAVGAGQISRVAGAYPGYLQGDDAAALQDHDVTRQGDRRSSQEESGGEAPTETSHCCSFQFCSIVCSAAGVTSWRIPPEDNRVASIIYPSGGT